MRTIQQSFVIFCAALICGLAAAENGLPPPTTIDIGVMPSSPVIAQAPLPLQKEVAPSTSSMVEEQFSEYHQAQPTPEQLYLLKQQQLEIQRILSNPYLKTPKPVVRSLAVSLNPGEVPPVIRVSKNMLTTVVFTDNEGNPWYIKKVALNRNQFSDSANKPSGAADASLTNILTIEPTEAIAYGNVSVTLKDKELPIILMLVSGQKEVDIRVDAYIPGKNPNAIYRAGISPIKMTAEIDSDALAILDGSIPLDAIPLISTDSAAQGWKYNNSLYVKTRLDLLHPNYMSRASTADGTSIYRFDGTNVNHPITLMQRQGQPVTVTFEQVPYYQYSQ